MAEALMAGPALRSAKRASIDQLVTDWSFQPSSPPTRVRFLRARAGLLRRHSPPTWRLVRAPIPAARWNCLFLFAAVGLLDRDQRQILDRIRRLAGRLLVVVASPNPETVDAPELADADALIWKELRGFDMSAYEIALRTLAVHSPGTTAYVQNDSVLGPFADIDGFVARARWDFTGFLASRSVENHVSSYAFIVRDLTPERYAALTPVLSPSWCYDGFDEVVLAQETCLARIAARAMTVGAFWYMPVATPVPPLHRMILNKLGGAGQEDTIDLRGNVLLSCPMDLLDAGHPFLKRSLFGKFSGLEDAQMLHAALHERGWR